MPVRRPQLAHLPHLPYIVTNRNLGFGFDRFQAVLAQLGALAETQQLPPEFLPLVHEASRVTEAQWTHLEDPVDCHLLERLERRTNHSQRNWIERAHLSTHNATYQSLLMASLLRLQEAAALEPAAAWEGSDATPSPGRESPASRAESSPWQREYPWPSPSSYTDRAFPKTVWHNLLIETSEAWRACVQFAHSHKMQDASRSAEQCAARSYSPYAYGST